MPGFWAVWGVAMAVFWHYSAMGRLLTLWPLFALLGGLAALNFPFIFQDFHLALGPPWAAYAAALLLAILVLREACHPNRFIALFAILLTLCPAVLISLSNGRLEPIWGLILLAAAVHLNQPRLPGVLLAVWAVCLGVLVEAEPFLFFILLISAGSLLATWPLRARNLLMGGAISLCVAWLSLASLPSPVAFAFQAWWQQAAIIDVVVAGFFLGMVAIQMIYHWRWWPAPVQLAIGLGAPLLLLAFVAGPIAFLPALPLALYTLLQRLDYQGRASVLRRR